LSPPVLIVHSEEDAVVAFSHSDVLLDAAGEGAERLVASGPHITAFGKLETRQAALDWIEKHAEN